MDGIDRKIAGLIQADSRISNAGLAKAVGVSVSTANERLHKLTAAGAIQAWRAVLDPQVFGAGLCAFVLIDVSYDGEDEAIQAIAALPEVQEIHHTSGPRSYLLKVRVRDNLAMQHLLQDHLKPLRAVTRTETIFVLGTPKETTEIEISTASAD